MDKCPGLIGGLNNGEPACTIPSAVVEQVEGVMDILPGGNVLGKWGVDVAGAAPAPGTTAAAAKPTTTLPIPTTSPAASSSQVTKPAIPATTPATTIAVTPVTTPAATPTTAAVVKGPVVTITVTRTSYVMPGSPATTTAPIASSPATNPGTASGVAGWNAIGCWSDKLKDRVLSGSKFVAIGNHQVTSTACIAACQTKGFSVAGTEFGGECFCGNWLVGSTSLPASACNMKCEGDANQICGGSLALSVFRKAGAAKRPNRHLSRHARA
jgi:hypothetical protein